MNPLPSDKKFSKRALILGLRVIVAAHANALAKGISKVAIGALMAGWMVASFLMFAFTLIAAWRGALEVAALMIPKMAPPLFHFFPKELDMSAVAASSLIFVVSQALFAHRRPSWSARKLAIAVPLAMCAPRQGAFRLASSAMLPAAAIFQQLRVAFMDVGGWALCDGASPKGRSVLMVLGAPGVAGVAGSVGAWGLWALFTRFCFTCLELARELKYHMGSGAGVGVKASIASWARDSAEKIESRGLGSQAYAQKEREDLDRETSTPGEKTPPPRL